MSGNIRFSVICPFYNSETYLEEAIRSVVAQSFGGWELILIDDGSRDTGSQIAARYEVTDKRIHFLRSEHHGTYHARKAGAQASAGEYILFLDSDDLLAADALETLSRALEGFPADALIFNWDRLDAEGKTFPAVDTTIRQPEEITGPQSILKKLYLESDIGDFLCRAVFRHELLDHLGGGEPPSAHSAEDTYMSFHLLSAAETVLLLTDVLYHYRVNPSSITNNLTPEDYLGRSLTISHVFCSIDSRFPELLDKGFDVYVTETFFAYMIHAPQMHREKAPYVRYKAVCGELRTDRFYMSRLIKYRSDRPKLNIITWLFRYRMYFALFMMLRLWSILLIAAGRRDKE